MINYRVNDLNKITFDGRINVNGEKKKKRKETQQTKVINEELFF